MCIHRAAYKNDREFVTALQEQALDTANDVVAIRKNDVESPFYVEDPAEHEEMLGRWIQWAAEDQLVAQKFETALNEGKDLSDEKVQDAIYESAYATA